MTTPPDATRLLHDAEHLIEQVVDDADSSLAVRAGLGTGLVTDLRCWLHANRMDREVTR